MRKVQLKTITAPKIKVADFHGDKVEGVKIVVGGRPKVYVLLRKLCENLGIDFSRQRKKVLELAEEYGEGCVVKMSTHDAIGRIQEQLAIELDFLPVFLMTIKSGKVKPEFREKLRAYKREAKEVLARHFIENDGEVKNEAVADAIRDAVVREIASLKKEISEIKAESVKEYELELGRAFREEIELWAKALLSYANLAPEATEWVKKMYRVHVIGRLEGKLPKQKIRITVKEFLMAKGYTNLTAGEMSVMGRFARQEYERVRGRRPSKAVHLINGATKEVFAYYYENPDDLPILEKAFRKWERWYNNRRAV